MAPSSDIPNIRVLPDDVANKIAAGEVVERPASVVKELVENALDARATRVAVRIVAAGRTLVEVIDNGHGMSEQNALLSIERHATSKIRSAQDLDGVHTLGFRGEALASIASVSRFTLLTRRARDESATQIHVDGGVLRDVQKAGAPAGSRVTVSRLYFNTPVRAKFLKGITTELGHCIDVVQRHALCHEGVGFQLLHNDRMLLDIPERASLRDRVALIWGLSFMRDMTDIDGEANGFRIRGLVGTPTLSRATRSHQFFFINARPVLNRSLQYGLEDAFRGLLTVGRYPVGVLLLETNPRFVDVNIHPTKREVRFRDERAARDAIRDVVREALTRPSTDAMTAANAAAENRVNAHAPAAPAPAQVRPFPVFSPPPTVAQAQTQAFLDKLDDFESATLTEAAADPVEERVAPPEPAYLPGFNRRGDSPLDECSAGGFALDGITPAALYEPVGDLPDAALQVFDTYLLVPGDKRLLIIDQHALHERLNFEQLRGELIDHGYESQQLAVPLIVEVAPSQAALVTENTALFSKLGIDLEPFGSNTFQVTAICHLYEESRINDLLFQVLDELAQGNLFDRENVASDMLRLATRACKASVRAGEPLSPEERRNLLAGFRRLRPPYTCPHGRPIIVELTRHQMEKSFRRIQ
jgi:DNA mismatch repair protein MutL